MNVDFGQERILLAEMSSWTEIHVSVTDSLKM